MFDGPTSIQGGDSPGYGAASADRRTRPTAPLTTADSARPGDGLSEMSAQGARQALSFGGKFNRRFAAFSGRSPDPGSAGQPFGADNQMVSPLSCGSGAPGCLSFVCAGRHGVRRVGVDSRRCGTPSQARGPTGARCQGAAAPVRPG